MNYFTLHDAEQFTFFRIPKVLFTHEKYKKMSTDARVLYGILLDRVSLSIKNNWIDEKGRVFIIFTREDVQEILGFGNQKVVKLFKELKKVDLIEEKQQGLNKPNIIYVKKFIQENVVQSQLNQRKCENHISEDVKITFQEIPKSHTNYTNISNTDFNNTQSVSLKKINKNKIDGQTENLEAILEKVKERLEIENLKAAYPGEENLINEIMLNIFDMYFSEHTIIKGEQKPQGLIRAVIMKLTYFHIEALISKFKQVSTSIKIKNNKAYMQSMIYNIVFENDLAITNDVQYNFFS